MSNRNSTPAKLTANRIDGSKPARSEKLATAQNSRTEGLTGAPVKSDGAKKRSASSAKISPTTAVTTHRRLIQLSVAAGNAGQVSVAGSFNNWKVDACPLRKQKD